MTNEPYPMLTTARLQLRPFQVGDGPEVRRLAGERAIAETTLMIPHPYPEGAAEAWIATHEQSWAERKNLTLAVTLKEDGTLVGAIGLALAMDDRRAELGYWIGVPWWNRGYATEAGRALLGYGFGSLGLHRIMAHHMMRNPASGRVMQKLGMQHEGVLRGHILKWGEFQDLAVYAAIA